MKLAGKVAVITGSGRGQGRSHALLFAREGADIVVNDVCRDFKTVAYNMASEEQMNSVVQEIRSMGRKAIGVKADVSNPADAERLIQKALDEFGKIDILINNAGIASVSPIEDMSVEMFDEVMAVNLRGVFLPIKYAVPHMKKRKYGRIISTASQMGLGIGYPKMAHYTAAKHGVVGLTKALALELAPYYITVNAVCPSVVDTDQARGVLSAYPGYGDEVMKLTGPQFLFPDRESLEPIDVSNVMLFLASDEARYVTGSTYVVDAGSMSK